MIADELAARALDTAHGKKIADIRAGLGYTCVKLDDGKCGLAYTFRNELGDRCDVMGEAGNLIGAAADQIIPWIKDGDRLRAAIGLAAVNAVLNGPERAYDKGNVLRELSVERGETFGMIGNFRPILSEIKTMTDNIYVFELNVPEGSGFYPESAIPRYLPGCDVVVITATTIINHTFDNVVSFCKHAKKVCLVGPSTPLCPEILGRHGITLLAGSIVKVPEKVLEVVSQGGGTSSMKPYVDQVLLKI